jgi:molybdate transport system substrate-binding protein
MTMRRTTLAALVAVTVVLAAPAAAEALDVYAATSLTGVFPALDKAPRYNFGGSNTLQLQIERGAPADVFASASSAEAQRLFHAGLCTRPVTFAINRLVLLIPDANPGRVTSVYSLRAGGRRVSVGSPGVPIGAYTRQLLRRLRLSSILTSNRVSQQINVGQVASQVALSSADAGFVYYTDGLAVKGRTKMIGLPKWAQPPVRYQLCAVRRSGADTRGAQAFIREVTGRAGRAALKGYGFGLPPRG